jgi:hypothetical protein
MKKLIFILLVVLSSCNPYARLHEPVKMNYCVVLKDYGSMLCRDYAIYKDSLILKDAGYYARLVYQRHTKDIKFINWPAIMVVKIK